MEFCITTRPDAYTASNVTVDDNFQTSVSAANSKHTNAGTAVNIGDIISFSATGTIYTAKGFGLSSYQDNSGNLNYDNSGLGTKFIVKANSLLPTQIVDANGVPFAFSSNQQITVTTQTCASIDDTGTANPTKWTWNAVESAASLQWPGEAVECARNGKVPPGSRSCRAARDCVSNIGYDVTWACYHTTTPAALPSDTTSFCATDNSKYNCEANVAEPCDNVLHIDDYNPNGDYCDGSWCHEWPTGGCLPGSPTYSKHSPDCRYGGQVKSINPNACNTLSSCWNTMGYRMYLGQTGYCNWNNTPHVNSSALDSKCFHTNQSSKGKTFTAPSTSTYELQIIDPNKTDNAALIAEKQRLFGYNGGGTLETPTDTSDLGKFNYYSTLEAADGAKLLTDLKSLADLTCEKSGLSAYISGIGASTASSSNAGGPLDYNTCINSAYMTNALSALNDLNTHWTNAKAILDNQGNGMNPSGFSNPGSIPNPSSVITTLCRNIVNSGNSDWVNSGNCLNSSYTKTIADEAKKISNNVSAVYSYCNGQFTPASSTQNCYAWGFGRSCYTTWVPASGPDCSSLSVEVTNANNVIQNNFGSYGAFCNSDNWQSIKGVVAIVPSTPQQENFSNHLSQLCTDLSDFSSSTKSTTSSSAASSSSVTFPATYSWYSSFDSLQDDVTALKRDIENVSSNNAYSALIAKLNTLLTNISNYSENITNDLPPLNPNNSSSNASWASYYGNLVSEEKQKISDLQKGYLIGGYTAYVKAAPVAANNGQYLEAWLATSDGKEILSNSINPKSDKITITKKGSIELFINDPDGDYSNNQGYYNVTITRTHEVNSFASIFTKIIDLVKADSVAAAKAIFSGLTSCTSGNPNKTCGEYLRILKGLLLIYVIVFGIMFMLGLIRVDYNDFFMRIVKIGLIITLLGPSSSYYFNEYLFKAFTNFSNTLIANVTGQDPANPFAFLQQSVTMMLLDPNTWLKIIALMFQGLLGFVAFLLIIYGTINFIIAFFKLFFNYMLCVLGLALCFALAPFFIPFALFSTTSYLFQNWFKALFRFALQPVILFLGLIVLNAMLITILQELFNFSACMKCTIPFLFSFPGIELFGTKSWFCIFWFSPWGVDNLDSGILFILFLALPLAISFCMVTNIMKKYAESFAEEIVKTLLGGAMTLTPKKKKDKEKTTQEDESGANSSGAAISKTRLAPRASGARLAIENPKPAAAIKDKNSSNSGAVIKSKEID